MKFLDVVLWLQAAYSVWQFIRVAKFLRLPYIFISCLWNRNFDKVKLKERGYLLMNGETLESSAEWENLDAAKFSYFSGDFDTTFLFKNERHRVCSNGGSGRVLRYLQCAQEFPVVSEELELAENVLLLKSKDKVEKLYEAINGGRICLKRAKCIVDYTSDQLLNVNFMRIISIIPLIMQAKKFDTQSIYASGLIILIDVLSYFWNKVWVAFKNWFFYVVKMALSLLRRDIRVPIHHLLSTGTDSFMYSDGSIKKSYWKKMDWFLVMTGCKIPIDASTSNLFTQSLNKDVLFSQSLVYFINGQRHTLEINKKDSDNPLYDIVVTDCNRVSGRRVNASLSHAHKSILFMTTLAETNTWPILSLDKNVAHFISPSVCMNSNGYEGLVDVELYEEEWIYIS